MAKREGDLNTEAYILQTARDVFIKKGFAATRMQDIAEQAGMNQALLHYYFRNKDKLFEQIFERELEQFFSALIAVWTTDKPLLEKLDEIVEREITRFAQSPHLPLFLMHELSQNNSECARSPMNGLLAIPHPSQHLRTQIEESVARGEIRPISADQFLVTVISLTAFPFVAKPLIKMMLDTDDAGFDQFVKERIAFSQRLLREALRPESTEN
jgi:TetR/AcrR family transcriptional regulator